MRHHAVLWCSLREWRYLCDQRQLLYVHVCVWLLRNDLRYDTLLCRAVREWWDL